MSSFLFTSESVSEGHPDKVADQISDAVLDAILAQDKTSRVAAETLVKDNLVVLAGEITTGARVNFSEVARRTIKRIGYDDPAIGFDTHTCTVIVAYGEQSKDIAQGVDEGKGLDLDQGAGDQGLMFGYACDETPQMMPLPIFLSHRLVERQSELRRDGRLPWLRPDAKSQVTVRYANGNADMIDTVVLSTQHAPGLTHKQIEEAVIEQIIKPVLPKHLIKGQIKYLVNPTGSFEIGGPKGDCGLTGRKIIVDTYGGSAPHGGGAFSGRTWSPLASRADVRSRCPTPSAWRARPASWSRPSAPARFPTTSCPSWCRNISTCAPRALCKCSTCCARSTKRPRPTATSAATSRSSPGRTRIRRRRSRPMPGSRWRPFPPEASSAGCNSNGRLRAACFFRT